MALNGYITSLITNQPLGKSNNMTTLRATGAGTFKHWDTHLAKVTWLVNARGSAN